MNYFLPKGYAWVPQEGIMKKCGRGEECVCNCIPVNIKPVNIKFPKIQEEKEGYSFCLQDADGNILGRDQKPFVCTKEEWESPKFRNLVLRDVACGVKSGSKAEVLRIFENVIKLTCKNQTPEQICHYEFGWNDQAFWWGQRQRLGFGKEYANALDVACLLAESDLVSAAVLAGIHGIMEKVLRDAGIGHNFVTYFVGETGLGKSALLKAVCNYYTETGNIITVGSDHKSIKKVLENRCDMTIVLDDFCKTRSDRVGASQLQIVSEIIQVSSDAARLLVDESSVDRIDGQARQHIVISAEQVINNESTLNRTFLVHVTEALPEIVFTKIKGMEKNRVFYEFLVAFSKFVGDNFTDIVKKTEANYRSYCADTKRLGECTKGSDNRINNTYAVQMVIAKVLIDYFTYLNIDSDILGKVRNSLKSSICSVCRNLKYEIMVLHKRETHKTYLEPLAEIVINMKYGKKDSYLSYRLADSEERFTAKNKELCDAFCIRNDYISFDGKHICKLLSTRYRVEGANPRGLSSELQYYSLAHADSEGKFSCKWGTKGRYYHVRVSELLDLIRPDLDDTIREYVIEKYER